MNWFTPKCPVDADEKAWIEESMLWLMDEFGENTLRSARVVLPTEEFFLMRSLKTRTLCEFWSIGVCGYMSVDPERVELEFFTDQ